MSEKYLTAPPWKALALKQGLKDVGLGNALAAYSNLDATQQPSRALAALQQIAELAVKLRKTNLKKDEVVAHLDELVKEVKKTRPGLEARAKSAAVDASSAAPTPAEPAEDDEEEAALFKKDLRRQMVSALGQVKARAPGEVKQPKESQPQLQFMACLAGKNCAVIVARKVGSATRKLLLEIAGVANGGKFIQGECRFEENRHTFVLEEVPNGLARRLAMALHNETGQKYKVRARNIDGSVSVNSDTDSDSEADGVSPADSEAQWKALKLALYPGIKKALEAKSPDRDQIAALVSKASTHEKARNFQEAIAALTQLRPLLAALSLRPGSGSPADQGPATSTATPSSTPTTSVSQVRFAPVPPEIPRPTGAGIKLGAERPRSGAAIIPLPPAPEAAEFVGANGKKISVAKLPDGRPLFTAPPPPVREITFSGGGAKGAALPGAVKALQESGVLKDARKIAGASVGSMTAALVAAGITSEEFTAVANDDSTTATIVEGTGGTKLGLLWAAMKNKLTTGSGSPLTGQGLQNLVNDVLDQTLRKRILEYMQQCGQDGKAPVESVVDIAKRLSGNKSGPTFLDYRQLSKFIPAIKEIVITGTYTEEFTTDDKGKESRLQDGNDQGQLYVFDADSEPDLPVAVAVHASASFPVAFKPVDIKLSSGLTVRFIDGGVMNNTPTSSSIGNERQLDPVPDSRAMTFVFEDSDGTSKGLLQGKVTPKQGIAARVIDWFVGGNYNAAEYAKNRDMADRPEEIVVVPLQVTLPPKKEGGKAQQIDMRDGTLNFGLSFDAKITLQAATENATKNQIEREKKPKAREFASDPQMFVSIGMADLETLKNNGYPGAAEGFVFRERVAEMIQKLLEGVKTELARKGGRVANLLQDKNTKMVLEQLDRLAAAQTEFQSYVGRELNKQAELDTLLEAIRKGGLKSAVLQSTYTVSDALKAHTYADNVLKQLVYPKMKREKQGGTAIEVLLVVERLLRAAQTPDDVNYALNSAINHFKNKSDKSIPPRGHKKFAQELERRLMPKSV